MIKISQKNLEIFSQLSGDFNPIHLEKSFAKNSYFNGQIIYGIYQVFLVLESFIEKYKINSFIKIQDIKANFINPLYIENSFIIKEKSKKKDQIKKYEIFYKNKLCSKISFNFKKEETNFTFKNEIIWNNKNTSTKTKQKEENITEYLYYDKNFLNKIFPFCDKYLNSQNIAILLASTRIVGMKIPGLHSIYSSFKLNFSEDNKKEQMVYSYEKHHSLDCYIINILNPCKGNITAFIRPRLIINPSYDQLINKYSNLQKDNTFKNQKALVIGASKGFGDICTKLLSIGGAKILATYNTTIPKENINNCSFIQLKIPKIDKDFIRKIKEFNPTHVYYFATPKISSQEGDLNKKILNDFLEYYIYSFDKILKNINPVFILSSSTTAIEELPLDMKEYSIAKAAMEIYMNYIKKIRNIKILTPRFPRAKTNQTLSLIPQKLQEPDELLYPILIK